MKNVFMGLVLALAVCGLVFIGSLLSNARGFSKSVRQIYSMSAVVYQVDPETDTVTIVDKMGCLWQFSGIASNDKDFMKHKNRFAENWWSPWVEGDEVTVIMDTRNTPVITDDVILKVTYDEAFYQEF